MALTYAQLTQAIQDYIVYDDPKFVANIPVIVRQAEDRIAKLVQLPAFRKQASVSYTSGTNTLTMPTGFWSMYAITVIDSTPTEVPLLPADPGYIREVYQGGSTGKPRHYGLLNDTTIIFGPKADTNYTGTADYFAQETSIVDAGTSWLGNNAEHVLLYGCLGESYRYIKGDDGTIQMIEQEFQQAINALRLIGEGRDYKDTFEQTNTKLPT